MTSFAFRSIVLGAAGVVAILMGLRASALGAPHPLCIAGGAVALACLVVLQPMIGRKAAAGGSRDPASQDGLVDPEGARIAALISLVAMAIGYAVASWAYSVRLDAGPGPDAPSILREIAPVFLAFAASSLALLGLAFPPDHTGRVSPEPEPLDVPGMGTATKLAIYLVLIAAMIVAFVVAVQEFARVASTEGATLDLLRVAPVLVVALASMVVMFGPRGARGVLLGNLVLMAMVVPGAIVISWATGLPILFAFFAALVATGVALRIIQHRRR